MTCARCQHFSMRDHPQQAAAGLGQCVGFLILIQSFVRWDGSKCGLYRPAREMGPRDKFIKKMESKK